MMLDDEALAGVVAAGLDASLVDALLVGCVCLSLVVSIYMLIALVSSTALKPDEHGRRLNVKYELIIYLVSTRNITYQPVKTRLTLKKVCY